MQRYVPPDINSSLPLFIPKLFNANISPICTIYSSTVVKEITQPYRNTRGYMLLAGLSSLQLSAKEAFQTTAEEELVFYGIGIRCGC
jgi:hypothetical protein